MGEFLAYSITSGLLLLGMFLAFRLTLAREKMFGYNRVVMIMIYIVAFTALPLIDLVKGLGTSGTSTAISMKASTVVSQLIEIEPEDEPLWGTVLIWVYFAGMAVVALGTLATWVRIVKIIARGEKVKKDGYTLVLTDNIGMSPFSWMRYVVMNRRDYELCGEAVTAHELRHIRAGHCYDLLLAQIVVVINWFNPAAWLMREELMLIHEYQADMAVLEEGHDCKKYQMMLIEKAVGARFPSLANSLNHSKLKKRITMMYQKKSSKGQRLKAIALVPAFALALGVTALPTVNAAITTIGNSAAIVSKDTEKSVNVQSDAREIVTVKKEFYGSEFTGNWINPCKGETLDMLATIKVFYVPADGGYDVVAQMYDKNDNLVKVGYKYCKGEPEPSFEAYPLTGLEEMKVKESKVTDKKKCPESVAMVMGMNQSAPVTLKVEYVDNHGGVVAVGMRVMSQDNLLEFEGAELSAGGKHFGATQLSVNKHGNESEVVAKFPCDNAFDENTAVTLNVNGKKCSVPLGLKNVKESKSRVSDVTINMDLVDGRMAYFYNGKQISHEEMTKISPSAIDEIKVVDHDGVKLVFMQDKL